MSVKRFTARFVVAEEVSELNSFVVALYENGDGSGEHIEFQRALSFDEQDVKLGMCTYCIVINGAASYYGGLMWWSIDSGKLVLSFTEEAARQLEVSELLQIDWDLDQASISRVEAGLVRIIELPPRPVSSAN